MAINDIVLTSAIRSNLASLQNTSGLLDRTQIRLSTGREVNSALDDAINFFAARGLENRAGDLDALLDGMGQAVQTLKAANEGLELITSFVEQLKAIANSARDAGPGSAESVVFEGDFDDIRTQIDQVIQDTGYRGINLLNGGSLTVEFNEDATSLITVAGVTFNAAGLSLSAADFSTDASITAALAEIDTALSSLRATAQTFGTNLTTIQNRESFTKNIIDTLSEGANKLVLADQNEESANLLALQTRQQLGVTSLSLASQASQAILNLF